MLANLLIVDDEKATRDGLRTALDESFEVYAASGYEEAVQILQTEKIDLMLTDLRMGAHSGMELLKFAMSLNEAPVTLMMTAYGSVDTAVQAMHHGAWHFVTKPLNLDEVEMLLKRALKTRLLETENTALVQKIKQVEQTREMGKLVGKSAAIQNIIHQIEQVAPSRATVLIEGESGTGKEVVAHCVHEMSDRSKEKMVIVHCAALSPQLLESELFGHEKGAFTGATQRRIGRFEQAHGGTLFLDEIGEIDATTQVKLLRVLSERTIERVGSNQTVPINVRVVAATNKNLKELVSKGEFREDLYFRLNVVQIQMPPLRDRLDDIELLASKFLREFAEENHRAFKPLTAQAKQLLIAYSWPGNIRELRTVIEHGVVMSNQEVIDAVHLPYFLTQAQPLRLMSPRADEGSVNFNLEIMEREMIQKAMMHTQHHQIKAAQLLGISTRTLQRKLKMYGISS